jgi:hypothetical protein
MSTVKEQEIADRLRSALQAVTPGSPPEAAITGQGRGSGGAGGSMRAPRWPRSSAWASRCRGWPAAGRRGQLPGRAIASR